MANSMRKPMGATGSPQAGKPAKPTASDTSVQAFVLEGSTKTLRQVPFNKIVVRAEDYAFRDGSGPNPFSKKALQALMESIMQHKGIHVPLLLRDLGNGTFLLVDGHRRYFTLKLLIEAKVLGFTVDMLLPANVLAAGTSELVMVATGLSANLERQPLAYEGRLKATKKLYELGMPRKAIAQLLNVGESTVDRDLALASDAEMMDLVREHCIQATNASSLLAAAGKHNRRDALMSHYKQWLEETKAQIAADVAALKAQDADLNVPVSKTWPQSRLTPQLVRHWRVALEKNQDLVDPGFRFKALVRKDGGVQRIEVDSLNQAIDDMSAEDVAKVLQRCVDLAADLEPVLTSKMAEEQDEEAEEVAKVSPGQQRLQQLGWSQFASESDVDDDYDPDVEPDHDPEEFDGPWGEGGQPTVE